MKPARSFHIVSLILLLSFVFVSAGSAQPASRELVVFPPASPGYALLQSGLTAWNTFMGSGLTDGASSIAVDGSGNVYVTGLSFSTWGSPVNAFAGGEHDVFVAKLDGSSGALIWNTFLGGSGYDWANGITVDGRGNVYVAGDSSTTWGTPVRSYGGGYYDGFVARLDGSSGGRAWNTFLGGSSTDGTLDITLDAGGNVYVSGVSQSSWGHPVQSYAGGIDTFVTRLDSSGGRAWHTFLGGIGHDLGYGIAVYGTGNVYVTGSSRSTWGKPLNPFVGGYSDAFVAKLNSNGGRVWHTFLGGSAEDTGTDIAVDRSGNVYMTGGSAATWGMPLSPYMGANDAFLARLTASGGRVWHTFLGASDKNFSEGIAIDRSGNVYVNGHSYGAWGSPVSPLQVSPDAYVARFTAGGGRVWNTFLGGSGTDYGNGIAVDGIGNVYVAGDSSTTWGSPVNAFQGTGDGFVAKLASSMGESSSTGAYDGWVLESGETSNKGGKLNAGGTTFNLGDDAADKQYRAVLSFDTSGLPDNAVIIKATLKIKRQGIVGTNPFNTHSGLKVDIRMPYFGPAAGLAISDFQAAASKSAVATFNKTPTTGAWYSAVLGAAAYPYIDLAGTTQFRLRFAKDDNDDLSADYLKFYSGNAGTAYRPVLVIEYYVP